MATRHTLFGSLLLAGALAACGGGAAAPSSAAPASTAAAKPSVAASKPAASTAASAKPAASGAASAKPAASGGAAASGSAAAKPAASGSAAAKPAPSVVPATKVATVKVADNPTLGKILTDGEGMTLYSFAPASDPASKDATKCATACLGPWPPFLTTDAPAAPSGVTGKFGIVTRTDYPVKQVTYNDMPLYYFVQDKAPGDAKGQNSKGFNGNWQVIKAS